MSELDKLLSDINKRYGEGTVMVARQAKALKKLRRVKTGMPSFDMMLGGGVPVGRTIELYGMESGGKTLIALKVLAAFQRHCASCGREMYKWDESKMSRFPLTSKAGRTTRCCANPRPTKVVWFDAEHAWDNSWASRFGVDTNAVFVIRAEYAEQGIDVADALIRSGEVGLLVVDSVAALTPSKEIEETTEKWQIGLQARLLSKAMRKWTSATNSTGLHHGGGCTVLLINQIRYKIGVMYGNPETRPAGKAIDFFASAILRVKKTGYMENKAGEVMGIFTDITSVKNKVAPPRRTANVGIVFNDVGDRKAGSSDVARQLLARALVWGIAKKQGSWFTIAKGHKYHGEDAAAAAMVADSRLLTLIEEAVWEKELAWLAGSQ